VTDSPRKQKDGEEGKMKKAVSKKEFEGLKKEIERKGEEIEQLKKSVEELRTKIQGNEETKELNKLFEDISGLFDAGLSIFSVSGNVKGEKFRSKGLLELIENLGTLVEKSETYRKRINIGEGGVIDRHVSSRPLGRTYTARPKADVGVNYLRKSRSPTPSRIPSTSNSLDEPTIDILEESGWLRVIAEMHGFKEDEISLSVDDDTLTISVDTPNRKYCKRIELPSPVGKDIMESSYRNGVLDIKLKKTRNVIKRDKD